MQIDQTTFFSLTKNFQWISPKQTQAWCEAFIPEKERVFFVDNDINPKIACLGQLHKKMGVAMLLISGECLLTTDIDSAVIYHFFESIAEQEADLIYVNSDSLYSPLYEVGIRQAGFLRPIGMFSTTLSKQVVTIDTTLYNRSWRKQLLRAQKNCLKVTVLDKPSEEEVLLFLSHHNSMQQRKHFSDGLTFDQLMRLVQDPHYRLAFVYDTEGNALAGRLFYCDKSYSYFLYAFTSTIGREKAASYMLFSSLIEYLASQKIETIDIGRLAPSTLEKNNVFLFKNKLHGTTVSYNGEWIFTRHKWIPLAFYLANKYKFKRIRV